MSPEILGILIGSGISLITSGLVTIMQNRHSQKLAKQDKAFEVQTWVRDKKVEVYVHLASFLDGLPICVDSETNKVDGPSFEESSQELTVAIERYKDSTAALHNYMKRQWSFVAGMADTFKEMKA